MSASVRIVEVGFLAGQIDLDAIKTHDLQLAAITHKVGIYREPFGSRACVFTVPTVGNVRIHSSHRGCSGKRSR